MELEPYTPNTLVDVQSLKSNLKSLRKQDIGTDDEEFMAGMVAVAVPLKNDQGQFFGALAMHAPTARMSLNEAIKRVPRLRSAADELIEIINE